MTNYNEAVNGDISNNPENPLQLSLSEGSNEVTASTGDNDQEYVTVTVPEGSVLDSVVLESYNPSDVAFIGVQEGNTFTEPLDNSAIRENILGYTLFGNPRQIGTDILDEVGNGTNAIGFEGALPSGDYTFALQQIGTTSDYTLDFNVSSASTEPEPNPEPTPEPPMNELPVISIDTLAGTFDADDNLITPNLVDSIDEGTPILSVTINSSVPVPEDGLIVSINSDLADITELVDEPAFAPFVFGGEFVKAIYNDAGVATGFQVRLLNPNAIVNFSNVGLESEDVENFSLFVEPSEGYTVSDTKATSAIAIYNTLDQVPTTDATPTVGMSISENSLIEGETETTISFNVDGEIPPGGVVVLVDSDVRFGLGEFDLLNAEVEGGVFPVTNGDSSGFYFKITEAEANITLIPRNDNLDDQTGEAISEGIEDFTFTLQQQVGYNIDSDAATVNFRIADDADAQIQVSLTTESQILIESSETTAVLSLNLSAPPPEEGITVAINSENLSDFDTSQLEVTGGSLVNINDDGTVNILVTEETATVNLTVNNDGMMEGLETAVFTLVEPGEDAGYQISLDSEANESSFDIYDTVSDAPIIVTEESFNDTIATATPTNITPEIKVASINGEISGNFFDSELSQRTDLTEDVDIYSLDLQAGDRVTFDIDSIPFENSSGVTLETGADLRLFNAAGEELVYNDEASAPGELFESGRDAYIDYTVEDAGTYYIGVSQAFNEDYDPNVPASGNGAAFSRFGLGAGEYNLEVALNPDAPTVEAFTEFDGESSATPIVSFNAVPGTFEGNDILSSQIVESLGAERGKAALLNFTFNVEGEIPEDGLEVIVKSDVDFSGFLDDLIGTPRTAVGGEILGAIYNEDGTPAGFKVLLTSPNASFPFPVGDRDTDDPDAPESIEFSLANSPNYTSDSAANTSNITFYDTLEQIQTSENVPQVGVSIDKTELVESAATEVNLSFNVEGEIPSDGLLVYVDSETRGALGEFDVFNSEITGGALPSPNGDASGFYFRIFENDANIKLTVFDETTNPQIEPEAALEGIEEFSFSLIASDGYTINPEADKINFTIADNPDSVVIEPEEGGLPEDLPEAPTDNDGRTTNNDTIPNAVDLGLNPAFDNLSVTIEGEIAQRFRGENAVDASEDVDFYSFDLNENQTITIDIDANGIGDSGLGSALDSVLRIFDAEGNELAINNQGVAADEIFQAEGDPYLEFTASSAGTYYAGISNLGNDFYDPFVLGSGSGWTFGERFAPDVYQVEFSLGEMFNPNPPQPETPLPEFGTVNADILEVEGSNGIIFAGSSDDFIDASISSGSNNRIYASSGDDTVILGMSDRIVGGAGDDKFFAMSGGDNIITGGEGADQFWIATAEIPGAANIITDFTNGEDVLGIAGLGIGFDDLSITQQDDNTLIAANNSELAILQGVGADSLIADNFAFG